MTTIPMYSLRTDGSEQWRITKFVDGDVESSYSTTYSECDCPAGHRHTCRHRQMLPAMLAHGIADTHWFYLHDAGGRIVDFNGTPKSLLDQLAAGEARRSEVYEEPEGLDEGEEVEGLDTQPVPAGQHCEGYRGFESKAAYEAHYSDPAKYADEIDSMQAYADEARAERKTFTIPDGHEAIRDVEGWATGEVRERAAGNLTATEIGNLPAPPLREPLIEHLVDQAHKATVRTQLPKASWRRM